MTVLLVCHKAVVHSARQAANTESPTVCSWLLWILLTLTKPVAAFLRCSSFSAYSNQRALSSTVY